MSSDQPDAGGDDPGLPLPTTDGASDHPVLGELDNASGSTSDSLPSQMAGTSGGSYQFSPEQIDSIIARWEEIRDELDKDQRDITNIEWTKAPGNEFASGDFIGKGLQPSLEDFMQRYHQLIDYIQEYIDKLEKARDSYLESEDSAAENITQAGEAKT